MTKTWKTALDVFAILILLWFAISYMDIAVHSGAGFVRHDWNLLQIVLGWCGWA